MIDHVELLVEEQSMDVTLRLLMPRIAPQVSFDILLFRGKPDLLKKLGGVLTGYRSWLPDTAGIVVVVDRDNDDCVQLKQTLELAARKAGFVTRAQAGGRQFQVVNRIAIEELEAWFFGDLSAVCSAYPGVPVSLASRRQYRHPDAISGGTAEALARVLKQAGHHRSGLPKVTAAKAIAAHMDVEKNLSPSFCAFRDGVRRLVGREENS